MKKKVLTIGTILLIAGSIGFVLAGNKAKIDKASHPAKEISVIPVKASEVKTDSFQTGFYVNGITNPVKEVKISSEVQGKLIRLLVKNGDLVRAGQVVAELDASVYQAQLVSIQSSIEKAKLDQTRYTRLIEMGGASQMQLESVELQLRSLEAEKKKVLDEIDHLRIRVPFNGKMENVNAELGSFVTYGSALGELIDNSTLKIEVYLSEQEVFQLKKGQEVQIESVVLSEPRIARITMISEKADATGKFLTEISLPNQGADKLKAGMLTSVHFMADGIETGLSIPVSALLSGTQEGKVLVARNNHAELRNIKTGINTGSKIQVLEGLQEGEQVVISGQLNLENGSPISIIR